VPFPALTGSHGCLPVKSAPGDMRYLPAIFAFKGINSTTTYMSLSELGLDDLFCRTPHSQDCAKST